MLTADITGHVSTCASLSLSLSFSLPLSPSLHSVCQAAELWPAQDNQLLFLRQRFLSVQAFRPLTLSGKKEGKLFDVFDGTRDFFFTPFFSFSVLLSRGSRLSSQAAQGPPASDSFMRV